jgi:superfamily I DNA and RNA helicase
MMETKMDFVWPEGEANDAEKTVWNALKNALNEHEGTCYFRYPVFSTNRLRREPDMLLLHRQWGLYVIECKGCHIDNIERIDGPVWKMKDWYSTQESPYTQAEDQMFPILGRLRDDRRLRKGRNDLITGHVFIALPFITKAEWKEKCLDASLASPHNMIFADDLEPEKLRRCLEHVPAEEQQVSITDEQFRVALGILQGTPVLNREARPEPSESHTKAAMLRQVETRIQSIDREQQKVAVQIPDGPQRIRGLAGSGKTVVMCMKAAEMHLRHPEWRIVYTFYTRSLSAQIKSLITRFHRYWSDQDPDWNKIHILHGWGAKDAPGLYSSVARKMKQSPYSWKAARSIFAYKEQSELLGKCCRELLASGEELPELFDAILIDEAQDFHFDYYKLCYSVLREPKRLIWAYDEVQSLESLSIPTTIDIFGTNADGSPVVDLDGTYPGSEIEKDIILHRCYRNPRPILVAAHIFGMGLLRPKGAVQFIPTRGGWEDIGYEVVSGKWQAGQKVTIRRPEVNSPHLLEKLTGYGDLVRWKVFDDRSQELEWIAQQIHMNILLDELKPEEIAVISLDWNHINANFTLLKHHLEGLGVQAVNTSIDTDKEVFQKKDHVTLTGIFKAKGNEASVIYVMGFEEVDSNPRQIVQERNQAFTAMTRTRGWCILTGVGKKATTLFDEINQILSNGPEHITFTVPDPKRIQRNLDNLEYERRRNSMKKAQGLTSQLKQLLVQIDDPSFKKAVIEQLQNGVEAEAGT